MSCEQTALPVWEHSLAGPIGSSLRDPSHHSSRIQHTSYLHSPVRERGRLLGPVLPVYWKVLGNTLYLKRQPREGSYYRNFVMAVSCDPQVYIFKSHVAAPQNGTKFGSRMFMEVIRLSEAI